jgi:hypothetical protein
VKLYKTETRTVVTRFWYRQLSFPNCVSHLDAALTRFISRMQPEDLAELRAVMLANNERVMEEMARRGKNSST